MVIIKGFEMPKSCSECPICYDQMECPISDLRFWRGRPENKEFKFTEERHPDCPLEEFPQWLTDDDFETIRIHLNALKEELCNQHRWKEAEEYQRIIDRFMVFPSADVRPAVHGRWIPVTERLPEQFEHFYVTCRSLEDDRKNWVIEGFYTDLYKWGRIPMIQEGKAKVIAWMPKIFPEPYEEETK